MAGLKDVTACGANAVDRTRRLYFFLPVVMSYNTYNTVYYAFFFDEVFGRAEREGIIFVIMYVCICVDIFVFWLSVCVMYLYGAC